MEIFNFSRIPKYRCVKGSQIKASNIVFRLLNVFRLFIAMIRVLMKSCVQRVWRNKRNVLRQTESHCAVRMTGFPKKSIWKFAASKAANKKIKNMNESFIVYNDSAILNRLSEFPATLF